MCSATPAGSESAAVRWQTTVRRSGSTTGRARVGRVRVERLLDLLGTGRPGDPALIEAETGRVWTYGTLEEGVRGLAGRLSGLGVGRGSRLSPRVPGGPGSAPP